MCLPPTTPTRRGRPPGRKNISRAQNSATSSQTPPNKRRGPGRPPGSKTGQTASLQGTLKKRKRSEFALTKCPECSLWLKGEETLAEHARSCGTDRGEVEEFTLLRGGRKLLKLSPAKAELSEDELMDETTASTEAEDDAPSDDILVDKPTPSPAIWPPQPMSTEETSNERKSPELLVVPEVEGLTALDKSEKTDDSMRQESTALALVTGETEMLPQHPAAINQNNAQLLQDTIALIGVNRTQHQAIEPHDTTVEFSPFVLGSLVTEFTTSPEPIIYADDLGVDNNAVVPLIEAEIARARSPDTSTQPLASAESTGQSTTHEQPLPTTPIAPTTVPSEPEAAPADDHIADDESVYELVYPDWDVFEEGNKLLAMPEATDVYEYETASECEDEDGDIPIPPVQRTAQAC